MNLIKCIKKPLIVIVNRIRDHRAMRNFRHERKIKRRSEKIRVGFLVQYLPAWNKTKPVYDIMKKDERFEVLLICVPIGIHQSKLDDPSQLENSTYDYFANQGETALNALIGKNKWLDLKKLSLDYIFFPRPYNHFMPKAYSSKRVSRYTKICLFMYGASMTKEVMEGVMNKKFFRHLYCYFAESKDAAEKNIKNYAKTHKKGYQKTVFYGLPVLSEILKKKEYLVEKSGITKDRFTVLWTPRWTTELALGGSNFFTYKDFLIQYAKDNRNVNFIFRPHPLMLNHFLETGELTSDQAEEFVRICNTEPNIQLDEKEDYLETMLNSDVLMTDISGIIPEYFVTEQPIIFCASNMILTPAGHTRKILQGCYIVNNQDEAEECLNRLREGKDELLSVRKKAIKELWGDVMQCEQKCIDELLKDSRNDQ